jgi:nucleotide-binding universal stress UspA family protein
MKSILLHVSDGNAMEARFQSALVLARAFDAHLTCLQVTPVEIMISSDFYSGIYATTELFDKIQEDTKQTRAALEQRLAGEGVRWDWLDVTEDPAFALIERAALADLVILGLPDSEAGKARALVADVAVTVRAPVLVVPQHLRTFDCSGAALVAWNGSMEAAHALRAALPLLVRAASVRIATVADDDVRLPTKAAAEYLSRHGVHAEICNWQRGTGRISDALLDGAKAAGSAYLVAGAYGHTRFREAILGGVTRELLEAASLPLLLTH